MADSDRLAELRRQRAHVQEHLAWLDREIARSETDTDLVVRGESATALPAEPTASDTRADNPNALSESGETAPTSPAAEEIEADAEAVMAEYRVASTELQDSVRRGCFLYFTVALLLLGAVVVGLYFALRHT